MKPANTGWRVVRAFRKHPSIKISKAQSHVASVNRGKSRSHTCWRLQPHLHHISAWRAPAGPALLGWWVVRGEQLMLLLKKDFKAEAVYILQKIEEKLPLFATWKPPDLHHSSCSHLLVPQLAGACHHLINCTPDTGKLLSEKWRQHNHHPRM